LLEAYAALHAGLTWVATWQVAGSLYEGDEASAYHKRHTRRTYPDKTHQIMLLIHAFIFTTIFRPLTVNLVRQVAGQTRLQAQLREGDDRVRVEDGLELDVRERRHLGLVRVLVDAARARLVAISSSLYTHIYTYQYSYMRICIYVHTVNDIARDNSPV
jgi:hypothetical protein